MGKRSDFKRRKFDAYDTPELAAGPLLAQLDTKIIFDEPCAGKGFLIDHLESHGHKCGWASDISPAREDIQEQDVFDYIASPKATHIITNPPWTRQILHPLIEHLRMQRPTWLLFDADWMHTKQAVPYLPYCQAIVSVGRISWMENGVSGKDNCAWYLFGPHKNSTVFIGKQDVS